VLNRLTPSLTVRSSQRARRLFAGAAFLTGLATLFIFPALAQNSQESQTTPLERRIRSILSEDVGRQTHAGIEVVSLRTGKRIAAVDPDRRFVPASTAKLFPAAVALARLSRDFKYRTTVETAATVTPDGRVQGDLALVGRGDPNLSGRVLPYNGTTERVRPPTLAFDDLAAQVARQGIRVVAGDLVVDNTYFVAQPYGQGWTLDDLQWGYGAPVTALALNDNVIVFRIRPGARAGAPVFIELEPPTTRFQIENKVLTVARNRRSPDSARQLTIDRRPGSTVVRLWGELREGSSEWSGALAMDDPGLIAGEVFRDALARNQIELRGTVRTRELYPAEVADLERADPPASSSATTVLAAFESLPLAESLKVILKVSQNLHAEMLLRTIGHERRGVGSVEAGLAEIAEFLKESGINPEDVLLRDGSGLSRQNLVTPSVMTALLRAMYDSPHRDLWLDLLPLAGTDGSLQNRLNGRTVAGRVRAKTGGLAGVSALAGYAPNAGGEMLAFTIFINHHNLTPGPATGLIDRIVQEITASR
jgi:D-alanyl-D-alanine carboxypeptidase/D-alanyl-D-alanine-endopeptidase (penicillin-binding protein 4)